MTPAGRANGWESKGAPAASGQIPRVIPRVGGSISPKLCVQRCNRTRPGKRRANNPRALLPPEEQVMSGTADQRRYRIILRGECQQMLAGALEGAAGEAGPGGAWIMASVRGVSGLYRRLGPV